LLRFGESQPGVSGSSGEFMNEPRTFSSLAVCDATAETATASPTKPPVGAVATRKRCLNCNKPLVPKVYATCQVEDKARFKRRKFCGRICAGVFNEAAKKAAKA
jgi:hypothetical protein